MIYTGIDLVEIKRIKNIVIKNPRFIARVFGDNERDLFETKATQKYQTMAANFAAKEAFAKAIGTGVRGFSLNEVEILRDSLGAPYLSLCGKAKDIAEQKGLIFSISLTHSKDTAAAVVIGFKKS